MQVHFDRNMHLGFAVQDVSDVFVRKTNPNFTIFAGSCVYACVADDGTIDVCSESTMTNATKTYTKVFMIGLSFFDYEHDGRCECHVPVVLVPNRRA